MRTYLTLCYVDTLICRILYVTLRWISFKRIQPLQCFVYLISSFRIFLSSAPNVEWELCKQISCYRKISQIMYFSTKGPSWIKKTKKRNKEVQKKSVKLAKFNRIFFSLLNSVLCVCVNVKRNYNKMSNLEDIICDLCMENMTGLDFYLFYFFFSSSLTSMKNRINVSFE